MIEFRDVSVVYPGGVEALKNVNVTFRQGEFVVIVGLSGAGKSTLLRSLNRLVTPTTGDILFGGESVTAAAPKRLRELRRDIGMIFQTFNLVKRSSVLRNVLSGRVGHVAQWRTLLGMWPRADVELALQCLERVNISDKARVRADALSGGQQQRVGIARALAQQPRVILADEPVASLDPPTSHIVMQDLKRINREDGITTVVNLHFIDMAQEYADRIIGLREGRLVFDGKASDVTTATFEEIYGRAIRPDDLRGAAG